MHPSLLYQSNTIPTMNLTRRLIPLFFFLSSLLLIASSVSSTSSKDLQQCFHKCTQDVQQTSQQLVCQKACLLRDLDTYYKEKEEEKEEKEEEEEEEEEEEAQPFPESSPQEEYRQCQQWCREEEDDDHPQKLKKCQQRCKEKLRKREAEQEEEEQEQEEGEGGRDGKTRPEPFPESSPREEEYRQCQQQCREEEDIDDPKQLKKCQKRCEEKLRKREEQEGGGKGGKTRPEPEKKLRHCQRRCVRKYGTAQERQICKRTCRKQYDREKGFEGPRDYVMDSSEEVPPGKQYEHCRKSCQRQSEDQKQQKKCESQCRTESSQKELHSEQDEEEEEEEVEESWESNSIINYKDVPRLKYQKCQQKCEKHKQSENPDMKTKCQQRCEKKYGRSDEKQGQKGKEEKEQQEQGEKGKKTEKEHREKGQKGKEEKKQQKQGEKRKETEKEHQEQRRKGSESPEEGENETEEEIIQRNPYYFPSDEAQSRFRTQEARLKVFDKFSEKSEVLQGIENYRLAVLEAAPNTFILPHHYDAESVMVGVRGKGTINLVSQERRKSYNIEFGDVIRVPAGTIVYLINKQNDENLEIAQLLRPVNNRGQFKLYFAVGGQYPNSYYRAFSTHLLYQVLNVTRDQVDRFFGQESQNKWQEQRRAIAIKASQEQLRALSQHEYSSSEQIINNNSKGPIRLRNEKPVYSNEYGKILEANPDEHRQIRHFDVFVHLVEINKGAIMVPHYNSRSTVVGLVVEGSGHFEMVCPHLSSDGGDDDDDNGKITNQLQVNRAAFSPGDVFVVPAGHPISFIPHPNQNLTILEFGINGLNNHRNFIAGKDSIVMKMEREAKEFAFNAGGEEVEQIFSSQKLSYFVPKLENEQEEQQGGNQHHRFLDFAVGLF